MSPECGSLRLIMKLNHKNYLYFVESLLHKQMLMPCQKKVFLEIQPEKVSQKKYLKIFKYSVFNF
jgi:hypothetical protein